MSDAIKDLIDWFNGKGRFDFLDHVGTLVILLLGAVTISSWFLFRKKRRKKHATQIAIIPNKDKNKPIKRNTF